MNEWIDLHTTFDGRKIVARVDKDGLIRTTATEEDREYQNWLNFQKWVEAGNTPEDFWNQEEI